MNRSLCLSYVGYSDLGESKKPSILSRARESSLPLFPFFSGYAKIILISNSYHSTFVKNTAKSNIICEYRLKLSSVSSIIDAYSIFAT